MTPPGRSIGLALATERAFRVMSTHNAIMVATTPTLRPRHPADRRLDVSAIASVYTGRAGKCCCGCAGSHSTLDRTIRLVAQRLIDNAADVEITDGDATSGACVSVDVEGRRYVAYMRVQHVA